MKAVTCLAEHRAERAAALCVLGWKRGPGFSKAWADAGASLQQIRAEISASEEITGVSTPSKS
jgi:hypothetical protein